MSIAENMGKYQQVMRLKIFMVQIGERKAQKDRQAGKQTNRDAE